MRGRIWRLISYECINASLESGMSYRTLSQMKSCKTCKWRKLSLPPNYFLPTRDARVPFNDNLQHLTSTVIHHFQKFRSILFVRRRQSDKTSYILLGTHWPWLQKLLYQFVWWCGRRKFEWHYLEQCASFIHSKRIILRLDYVHEH